MQNSKKRFGTGMLGKLASMLPSSFGLGTPSVKHASKDKERTLTDAQLQEVRSLPRLARKHKVAEYQTTYYQNKHAKPGA